MLESIFSDVKVMVAAMVLPPLQPDARATVQHTPRMDRSAQAFCCATPVSLPATQGQRHSQIAECSCHSPVLALVSALDALTA